MFSIALLSFPDALAICLDASYNITLQVKIFRDLQVLMRGCEAQ